LPVWGQRRKPLIALLTPKAQFFEQSGQNVNDCDGDQNKVAVVDHCQVRVEHLIRAPN
jgi:hypothetical protein